MMQIVTHSGKFHCDEVMAVAMLRTLNPAIPLKRLYAKEAARWLSDSKTFVLDIGREYDPDTLNFDHHQNIFLDESGHVMATAGMVWEAYGDQITTSVAADLDEFPAPLTPPQRLVIKNRVRSRLIHGIDAHDADGEYQFEAQASPGPVFVQTLPGLIGSLNHHDIGDDGLQLVLFEQAVSMAKVFLAKAIHSAALYVKNIEEWEKEAHPRFWGQLIIMNKYLAWQEKVHQDHPEALFVMYPSPRPEAPWALQLVPEEPGKRTFRFGHPGIQRPDWFGGFIHQNGFIAGCASKEEAMRLATYNLDRPFDL